MFKAFLVTISLEFLGKFMQFLDMAIYATDGAGAPGALGFGESTLSFT